MTMTSASPDAAALAQAADECWKLINRLHEWAEEDPLSDALRATRAEAISDIRAEIHATLRRLAAPGVAGLDRDGLLDWLRPRLGWEMEYEQRIYLELFKEIESGRFDIIAAPRASPVVSVAELEALMVDYDVAYRIHGFAKDLRALIQRARGTETNTASDGGTDKGGGGLQPETPLALPERRRPTGSVAEGSPQASATTYRHDGGLVPPAGELAKWDGEAWLPVSANEARAWADRQGAQPASRKPGGNVVIENCTFGDGPPVSSPPASPAPCAYCGFPLEQHARTPDRRLECPDGRAVIQDPRVTATAHVHHFEARDAAGNRVCSCGAGIVEPAPPASDAIEHIKDALDMLGVACHEPGAYALAEAARRALAALRGELAFAQKELTMRRLSLDPVKLLQRAESAEADRDALRERVAKLESGIKELISH